MSIPPNEFYDFRVSALEKENKFFRKIILQYENRITTLEVKLELQFNYIIDKLKEINR